MNVNEQMPTGCHHGSNRLLQAIEPPCITAQGVIGFYAMVTRTSAGDRANIAPRATRSLFTNTCNVIPR